MVSYVERTPNSLKSVKMCSSDSVRNFRKPCGGVVFANSRTAKTKCYYLFYVHSHFEEMVNRKSKKGRAARNAQKAQTAQEPEELVKAPHSFVINRGQLGKYGNELLLNFRKLMEPYTASQLRVQKNNVLKDFIHIAGPLNVSHMVVFTKSDIAFYLRFIRLPRGPTLTFKIHDYVLARDVISSLKKAVVYDKLFQHHPLLVLNNFSGEGLHFKLMTTMFQSMFPTINVNKINLNTIRRCLLLDRSPEDECIYLRHFAIKVVPCGMSKAVKKLIQNKVPDLGQFQDFDDFMSKAGNLSESEAEMDGPTNRVVLPQAISSRGNIVAQQSAIRLYELGPRIKLELIKIEEGIMSGEVLFHKFVKKTPEEIKAIKAQRAEKRNLKAKRKAIQEENVHKKRESKNKFKKSAENAGDDNMAQSSDDDDNEWYKKEVGEDALDEDDLPQPKKKPQHKRKSVSFSDAMPLKRKKLSRGDTSEDKTASQKPTKTFQDLMRKRKKNKEAKKKKQLNKKLSSKVLSSKLDVKKRRSKSTRRRR